jgi:ElaB/YqjD/DUF883 family membrane-anchored ribosome-binding protein
MKWEKLTDEDLDAIKNDLGELATRLQARYGLSIDEAREQAQQLVQDVSETADDVYRRATAALDDAAHRVDEVVKDNAWATVGGAVLLGAVIGYLIGVESARPRSRW